jgi:hypothetical protein
MAKIATSKTKEKPAPDSLSWNPEKVRRFRMVYDSRVKEGINMRSVDPAHDFLFEGAEYRMGFAHYLLEYLETCVYWPPQSRVYANTPKLEE